MEPAVEQSNPVGRKVTYDLTNAEEESNSLLSVRASRRVSPTRTNDRALGMNTRRFLRTATQYLTKLKRRSKAADD